jgi:subtilisin-like proprotein convertase family protein
VTRTKQLSFVLFALLLSAAPAQTPRHGWDRVKDGLRLMNRDVLADRSEAVPRIGEAFYSFTSQALSRETIEGLRRAGLRYLGVSGQHVYTFVVLAETGDLSASMRAAGIMGTARVEREDRLEPEVARYLGSRGRLPRPLRVGFHPFATAGEVLALYPDAAEAMRLPLGNEALLMEEQFLLVRASEANTDLLAKLASSPIVGRVGFDAAKVMHNAASRAASRADALYAAPYGLDGTGVVVGHWDGGSVSSGHRDFGGRVTNYETSGVNDHATHTAGTILGSGTGDADAKGYATGATMVAYDFYGDAAAERREAKHEHYHQHDNHSWGSDGSSFGGYDALAGELDGDGRDALLMAIKSAGNDGQRSEIVDQNYGFDSLSPDSTGKNVLIIGATEDDGALAPFSSRGPTNDGRVKPDLSANGSQLYSTLPGQGYGSMSGTSMSAPSVSGMMAMLSELYTRTYGRRWAPDEARAIMLHTVTDVFHVGPDYRHGWGNADTSAAANLILSDGSVPGRHLARGAVREGENVEWKMDVPAGAPEVKVTMTWLDSTAQSTAMRALIDDLDLVLIDPAGTQHFPWTLDPANPFSDAVRTQKNELDNVEQVLVDAPVSGVWTVRVAGLVVPDPMLRVQGFVVAASHALDRTIERVAVTMPANGMQVPDGDMAGVSLTFDMTSAQPIRSLRAYVEMRSAQRGQIRIELTHPDGTTVAIETEDTSSRRDIYAVFPDLRSYADDTTLLYGRPGNGTWTLKVIDTTAGQTSEVLGAMLELEIDGALPPQNQSPVANAGKDASAVAGANVMLDGTMSSDPDGDALAFVWTQQSGATVVLNDANTAVPAFVAPALSEDQELVFRLTLTDARSATAQDDVTILVVGTGGQPANMQPTARVNGPLTVESASRVVLDASGSSDPDGDALAYSWVQTGGHNVTIEAGSQATTSFLAPVVTEGMVELSFRVEVSDGRGGLDLEDMTVTVVPLGMAPPMMPPENMQMRDNEELRANGVVGNSCACTHTSTRKSDGVFVVVMMVLGGALFSRKRSRRTNAKF